ncbi:hypothetical protein CHCC19466_1301 [Bacillus licheniformis]|uniref:hypothetical protein n=1 Tax=Bacillus licheniformis TaxID=1402 RepID=UPI0002E0585B|nr:hypothetical protein [Bacillus licheniformis]MEC2103732.1 hypothetical protein [Bacillus licheniformis]TWK19268.1 hypothetical protein CHCC20373_2532 [Bacillus licheniformis]TWK39084.1 hypothetical protein CHCC20368_2631 [Bacillus licheniformis]TWL15843.1 hypothetical protein CHCC19466_1301 [Bacillus licheniformis]TWL94575.1 hypothetical protein CHCC15291_3338 [Bacillus licheniformis]
MTNNEKLLNALMQFKNSAYEIREFWEQADSITDSKLCDDYPRFPMILTKLLKR